MKDQYVGDIGDYGKYGLLKFLAQKGITVGVNWYLTPKDETGHGGDTKYLKDEENGSCDPEVFRALKQIVDTYKQNERRIQMVQEADLIPGAIYFGCPLDLQNMVPIDRYYERRMWYNRSILAMRDTELVFADPDNGISYRETNRSKKGEKYVFPEEIAGYFYRGKDVVFYCHKGRRSQEKWEKVLQDVTVFIPQARVFELVFRRGPQRSYIFVIHPEKEEQYQSLLREFAAGEWQKHFCLNPRVYCAPCDRTAEELQKDNWQVIERFQKMYQTKHMQEGALCEMPNEQIERLINAASMVQGKSFYNSFRKNEAESAHLDNCLLIGSGFMAPTIGVIESD